MKTEELRYWINEREFMRIKRFDPTYDGPDGPPWSNDPAMANVRYCNVRREDDKVTKWVRENWRNQNVTSPNLTLAMTLARMVNWPDTLACFKFPHEWTPAYAQECREIIRGRQTMGYKAWTSAYTISTCGRSMLKEDYIFGHVLPQVAMSTWNFQGKSLAEAWTMLTRIDGLGSFLAAQIIADLKNTPGHGLASAPDWWDWSAPGPGSMRGLDAFFGYDNSVANGAKTSPKTYHRRIELCYTDVAPGVFPYVGRIHMQDFQNCLCEFSKYMRVKEGDGRVRNKYDASADARR